jgi:hypothetical protein
MSSGKKSVIRLFGEKVQSHVGGINSSVTVLRNIRRACEPFIEKYDNCLAENKSNPMACLDFVREVFQLFTYDSCDS